MLDFERAYTYRLYFRTIVCRRRPAQKDVSFPTQDGGVIYADAHGESPRAVVLARGGRFHKQSWERQARTLAEAGFLVLAIDFRGYDKARGPGQSDPMNAYLDRLVLLGAAPNGLAEKLKSATLFIVARDDANDDLSRVAIDAFPASAPPMLPPTTDTLFAPVLRR